MNSIDTPTVAVVGAGYWGKNLVRNFHALRALTLVCDSDEKTLLGVREEYKDVQCTSSYTETLTDPAIRGVVIATPAVQHAFMVKDALLAGKDVLVEKPLALTEEEGKDLVQLANDRNQILMVGHLLWYHPAILKLKEMVNGGELGRLQYIYSNRLNLGKIRREENILWSFVPHDISVILGLVGEMPERVQAQGGYYLHKQIADVTVTSMAFPSGVYAHVFVSWLHPYKEQRLVVVGDRKMAVFNDIEPERKLLLYPHTIDWRENVPIPNHKDAETVSVCSVEPLKAECEHFLECLKTRDTPRTDGREALRVLQVLGLCQEALENGNAGPITRNIPKANTVPTSNRVLIHPTATVDDGAEIGPGTKIWHYSHVMSGARIGRDCVLGQNVYVGRGVAIGNNVKIQNNVSVYEGVTLEDGVFCGPSMVFTNVINPRSEIEKKCEFRPTLVKKGATLGASSTILCGHTIGRYVFVGASSLVTKDVPDHALVVGVPARIVGWMCRCGVKLNLTSCGGDNSECATCQSCGAKYVKTGEIVKEVVVYA